MKTDQDERKLDREEWDERLEPGSSGRYWFYNHRQRYEFASRHLPAGLILDLGCGYGYGTGILARRCNGRIIGMDVSLELVLEVKRKLRVPNVTLVVASGEHLPFKSGVFRGLVSFEVIEHLSCPDSLCSEAYRVLGDNLEAYVSTPNKDLSSGKNPFHLREFSDDEFIKMLSRAGFQCRIYYQMSWWDIEDASDAPKARRMAKALFLMGRPVLIFSLPWRKIAKLVLGRAIVVLDGDWNVFRKTPIRPISFIARCRKNVDPE